MAEDGPAAELIDLGGGVEFRFNEDGIHLWKHPECRSWAWLAFDERGSGHRLVTREPLTIEGSLLCPMGCGKHGFVREGKWVAA